MSTEQRDFIKWFGGIAASLVVAFIIGGVVLFRVVGVLGNSVNNNATEIQEVKENHRDDVQRIYDYMRESRADQKQMLET